MIRTSFFILFSAVVLNQGTGTGPTGGSGVNRNMISTEGNMISSPSPPRNAISTEGNTDLRFTTDYRGPQDYLKLD